jgi:hypothetical protein
MFNLPEGVKNVACSVVLAPLVLSCVGTCQREKYKDKMPCWLQIKESHMDAICIERTQQCKSFIPHSLIFFYLRKDP